MSPKKAMFIGVLLYLLSFFTGLCNMWYIRQGYNPTLLTSLVLIQVAFSFSSIALVGYGTLAYLIAVIREAVRKQQESGGE
ncbi:MAG: hypothetical protein FGF48_05405 [Candidatus Brockarchaeota archaeon]|nr:hypothetical protein [Candidatus Brockarchaeota archaeon]